ncbi:hypothetical protein [Commensalibacter sp. A3DC]|uniref:hypothetical protein n=1 Tax=Commensalibacter sp. A3DC TaxID=3093920 RepID=UPI0039B6E1E1
MPNINYNEKENYFLIYDHEANKLAGILYTKYNDQCNNVYNDNSVGDIDMEKRLLKLEAGIDFIKDKLSSHDDELKKIDDKFDKIDARFDKIDANFDKLNDKLDNKLGKIDDKFDKFPTKDFMKISISDAVKSIKLWMLSIILFSLSSLIISIIKLFNLHNLFH